MLSRINGVLWADEGGNEDATLWSRASMSNGSGGSGGSGAIGDSEDEHDFHSFKSMLDDDWFLGFPAPGNPEPPSFASHHPFEAFQAHQELKDVAFPLNLSSQEGLLIPSVDSLDQDQSFLTAKSAFSTLFGTVCSNPFDAVLDLGCDASGLLQAPQMSNSDVMPNRGSGGGALGFTGMGGSEQLVCPSLSSRVDTSGGAFASMGSDTFENSSFLNRSMVLRPLVIFPPARSQPTLFQKRAAAALRQNSTVCGAKGSNLDLQGCGVGQENRGKSMLEEEIEKKRKGNGEDEMDEVNIDASGLNYDTDDAGAENAKDDENSKDGRGGSNSNANSTITGSGDRTGKKKGLPAKNLMAERRRRKKLNDRLYMLRSVVPKISKMDRTSILGDAIEYLKELLQRINDLHSQLESTPSSSSIPVTNSSSFHPLTPTLPTLPCRVKEELCPSSSPSPNGQSATVEVRIREGQAVNIHMFCARIPGLLLSTMRALDGLGLDIQQAVISCFNGFSLDVFRAEQCKDGPAVLPEDIKAVLLHSAGFANTLM